jgi:hypothetical protein
MDVSIEIDSIPLCRRAEARKATQTTFGGTVIHKNMHNNPGFEINTALHSFLLFFFVQFGTAISLFGTD